MDYEKICFVVMPFGKKTVEGKIVDFDLLYEQIFEPAISGTVLPEGGFLEPHRTDRDFFSGDIKLDMFQYLEYSRFVLADITGLNFNVGYELGARHRARESGTAIFRQVQFAPPFDISSIKAFPYEYEPNEEAEKSRELVKRVLTESLLQNRLDSPVWLALSTQRKTNDIDLVLNDAENAIRSLDWIRAMDIYRGALKLWPANSHVKMMLGLLCRDRGIWNEAITQFDGVVAIVPLYGEAHREKGVAENKLAQREHKPLDTRPAPGEIALRRAVELNSKDFDAYASLGGVLKRAGRFQEALEAYEEAVSLSGGHPYPLLNALKLRVPLTGRLDLSSQDKLRLIRAERLRDGQAKLTPAFDSPWCFFDLAEIRLYRGDVEGFLSAARAGLYEITDNFQWDTFVSSLELLRPAATELPWLSDALLRLATVI
ncbi:tetratricopeptide repeat protein [Bradyrhizobium guangzhouense]|uniref:Tetratricopeptide repeat protein n=1 Tax=Bradyrhizobium guangzhouense TaxID=1325095 RepID=A0AAE6CBC8_9BRAD|nr:tetratricopeptide repeat protein [Bradyrhizobium guangzhouense]QAU49674.1 hypothetical protein XH91_32785 [Bradyrhizobium guangzhouense]